MKILIIDDERSIRNSLKEMLGDEGYEVDVAEDGMAALSMGFRGVCLCCGGCRFGSDLVG